MKKLLWYILTFISCFVVGMLTRIPTERIPIYGFHATLAAFPISFLLVLCFRRTADKPVWIQIIPVLLFGLILGMMSPIMAFYNVGAAVLAAVLTYVVKRDKASVLAFGYASFSYPLVFLGGKLFSKTPPAFRPVTVPAVMVLTALLSLLGTVAAARLATRKQDQSY